MEAGKLDPVLVQRTLKQIYRLYRVGTFHQINNDAIRTVVDETRAMLEEIRREDVKELTLLFDGETVLVNSQMLRASREVYETSREFGAFLQTRDVNLLSLSTSANSQDLQELVSFFLNPAMRSSVEGEVKLSDRVTLRRVEPGMLVGFEDEGLHPVERVLLVYALTVLVLRRLHESAMAGEYSLAGYFKRLARQIAQINYAERPVVLDVILASHLSTDDAKRTANAAVIAAAMVRQTGVSEATTSRVVMTTLMSGVGTARQRSHYFDGHDPLSALLHPFSASDLAQEPDAAAAAVIRLGTLRGEAALRSIVVRDARARIQGSVDGAWNALFESRIVATARRFVDALTASDASLRSPSRVIESLREAAADALDHLCLDLLTNGIRLYPPGTVVELSSGWTALVLEAPSKPSEFDSPRLLLLHNPAGADMELREVDLRDRTNASLGHVKRVVDSVTPSIEQLRVERLGGRWRGAERNRSIAEWREELLRQRSQAASFKAALAQETEAEAVAREQARRADAEVFATASTEGKRKFGLLTNINKSAAHLSVRGTTAFLKIGGPLDPRLTPTNMEPIASAGGLRSTGAYATVSTGSHDAVDGRDSGSFVAARGTGSHAAVASVRERSGTHRAVEGRQTGSFAAVASMPSDPLAGVAPSGARSGGTLPPGRSTSAITGQSPLFRTGSQSVVTEQPRASAATAAAEPAVQVLQADAMPEMPTTTASEGATTPLQEPLSAAERIRRRLGQTGSSSAVASETGVDLPAQPLPEERPQAATIPPGLDPNSVLRIEADQLAEVPSGAASSSAATILRRYARRTDPGTISTVAPTVQPAPAVASELDALLADYLGDKKG